MEHHHHDPAVETSLIELLDLDAEVQPLHLPDVISWVRQQVTGTPVRIVDLGAGTGTGTVALAEGFDGAEVIAVDRSAGMLARIRARADEHGVGNRVRTVHADLDVAWPACARSADLVWAASALHELADPGRVFAEAFAAIRPGGLLAVVEMDAPPRFLPDDIGLGRPGLEERCHDALGEVRSDRDRHPDWAPRLEQAGFTIAAKTFTPAPTLSRVTGRYARAYLNRIRPALSGRLAGDDLDTLDTLLATDGPHSLLHRDDLLVRGTRTAWAARKPATAPAESRSHAQRGTAAASSSARISPGLPCGLTSGTPRWEDHELRLEH